MIWVAGNIVADMFVSGMDRLPSHAGDEYVQGNVAFFPSAPVLTIGGNAGNTAYVLGTLGAPVTLFGALGDDAFGALAREWLARADVTLSAIQVSSAATSTTVVATDTLLNRVAYHHAGANDDFSLREMPLPWLDQAKILFVTSYPICARMRDAQALAETLSAARAHGIVTALDIGPDIAAPLHIAEIAAALPHVDYLLANAHELSVLTHCLDLDVAIAAARAAGVRCVVAKRGPLGARLVDQTGARDVAGFQVEAKFTVGAGDSFNAGFLFGLTHGWPLERAARFANATAALVVSGSQGVLGCPDRAHIDHFLATHNL